MNASKHIGAPALAVAITAGIASAAVTGPAYSTVGVGGYDLVSYQAGKKPLRGNGNHVVVHDGVTYLFSSEENKRRSRRHRANTFRRTEDTAHSASPWARSSSVIRTSGRLWMAASI